MASSTNTEPLSLAERLIVVSVSIGFVLVLGLLGWLFWPFNPVRETDWIGRDFWEPVGVGPYQVPRGIAALFALGCYLILLPIAYLVFVVGVLHGLRGKRTQLASWLLREMSQEEVRKRHDGMIYLRPAIGWAILLGFLVVIVGVLVWVATGE